MGNLYKLVIYLDKPNLKLEKNVLPNYNIEFPRINEDHTGAAYSIFYGVNFTNHSSQYGLIKYDFSTQQPKTWFKVNHYAGEPIFVKNPKGSKEDDGVLLAIVYDCVNKLSYLLVLNANTMQEVARLQIPFSLPYGLHGNFWE